MPYSISQQGIIVSMHRLRKNTIVDESLGISCMKVITEDIDHFVHCMNLKLKF